MPRCVSEEVYRRGKEFQAQGLSAFKAALELDISHETCRKIYRCKDYEEYRTPVKAEKPKARKAPKAPEAAPVPEAKEPNREGRMVDFIRRCELFHMADGKVQMKMEVSVWESLF